MSENDNEVNPMPENSAKHGAAALKSLIGIVALGDMVCFHFGSKGKSGKVQSEGADMDSDDDSPTVTDAISAVLTLVDFALSCGVGYGIYSPMDVSNGKIEGSNYKDLIKDTSNACSKYTYIWVVKTIISLLDPTVKFVASSCEKLDLKDGERKLIKRIIAVAGGALACVSAGMEINACVEAGRVDDGKLNGKQKTDKTCFMSETMGYILDDARAVVDYVKLYVGTIDIQIIVARQTFAAGYAAAMFAEAGYINGTW